MGVRSDIAIIVDDKYAKTFSDLIDEIGIPAKKVLTEDGTVKGVYFESIKWYERTDEPINNLMKFLRNIKDDGWGFIETGEDNYINREGFPYEFGMSIYTTIDGPWNN